MTEQEQPAGAPVEPQAAAPATPPAAPPPQVNAGNALPPNFESAVAAKVAEVIAPVVQRNQQAELAESLGLNSEQAALVQSYQQKYAGMTPQQAHLLARAENIDKFQRPGFDPRRHQMLPPSGTSPRRSGPEPEKPYEQRIAEAPNAVVRQQIAKQAFKNTIIRGLAKSGSLPTN